MVWQTFVTCSNALPEIWQSINSGNQSAVLSRSPAGAIDQQRHVSRPPLPDSVTTLPAQFLAMNPQRRHGSVTKRSTSRSLEAVSWPAAPQECIPLS
jgi:hypothetical protein